MTMSIGQEREKAAYLLERGEYFQAARLYFAMLDRDPGDVIAATALRSAYAPPFDGRFGDDVRLMQQEYGKGDFVRARERAEILTLLRPDLDALHNFAGAAAAAAGNPEAAVASYDRAIVLRGDSAEAWSNRGAALRDLGRLAEALASSDMAIGFRPDHADAHLNRGLILHDLGRLDEAVAAYDAAIMLRPGLDKAHYNRGNALRDLKRLDAAAESYLLAIGAKPDQVDAWSNLGNVLQALGRLEEALASHDQAIVIASEHAPGHFNRGSVLQEQRRFDEAAAAYEAALGCDPELADAAGRLFFMRANMCLWPVATGPIALAALGIETAAVAPFSLLALEDDPRRDLLRAEAWARRNHGVTIVAVPAPATGPRIRIGYYSADFHDHATMLLMARLFELHDRDRFEIHAFSYGPDRDDGLRRRLLAAVEHFHDVRAMGDQEVAALSRDLSIDIAVDLKGYTQDSRPGILAHRAAPLQVNYLGYPGSMGAGFIDYLVADAVLVPEASRRHYREKIVALPGCYQVNDDGRPIAADAPDRGTLGLPATGFVFCCFNNNYKIGPAEFDIWMRCLARVEGSVLWLLRDNIWAEANLRCEAAARGIAPDRLVFAERMPPGDHLARQRRADLFLDTFHCNAHTTASDALWAGLPVVTRLGAGFAARVAGSLLHALDLPELVTDSSAAYEALIVELATDAARLAAIRARLAANRSTKPLFDSARFTRALERGYAMIHARRIAGHAPDHVAVPDEV
jgi:protein O-GlcNAc transferase